MTLLLVTLPSFVLGVALMGIVGVPIARRRAYNDGLEDARVLVGPALLREDLVLPPAGARLPLRIVDITDPTEVWQPARPDQTPGQLEPEFDVPWPRWWQGLWPMLLFVACFWDTRLGRFVDRVGAWRWWLAQREPRWWVDYEIPARRPARHAAEELDGEAERRRRALFEPTQFLRLVDLPDFPDWIRYLGPGWRDAIEPIPVAQVGELVAR